MHREIVVTGLGLCTPVGQTADETWTAVKTPIRHPPEPLAEDPSFSVDKQWVPRQHLRGMTKKSQAPSPIESGLDAAQRLASCAVREALTMAGLWESETLQIDPARAACVFSASKPLFVSADSAAVEPPDAINTFVATTFGLRGESRNVIAACATGAYTVALGAQWIDQGLCDVAVAGSVEPPVHPLIAAGFARMGVLSSESVMRPFDRERSGFIFGAGAGAIVLESEAHARRRAGAWLARLCGWGLGADPHGAVAFNSAGGRIAAVIERARRKAALPIERIGHVNAHGTATRLNDCLETQALSQAFGGSARRLLISATKSTTGHLLGAAGSVEAALTTLALRDQFVPPTATLREPDPECALDYTPGRGRPAAFDHAMSLSFGFGGSIGVLIFGR